MNENNKIPSVIYKDYTEKLTALCAEKRGLLSKLNEYRIKVKILKEEEEIESKRNSDALMEEERLKAIAEKQIIAKLELERDFKIRENKYEIQKNAYKGAISNVIESVKLENDKNTATSNSFLKKFDCSLTIENNLNFTFSYGKLSVLLKYDCNYSTFELLEMNPTPKKFNEMRDFLKRTNDIAGFLNACRKHYSKIILESSSK